MKKNSPFLYVAFFLLCWVVLLGQLYEKGKHSKALIYAEIPEETIRFFEYLSSQLDLLIRYDPNIRLKDWKNKHNYGEDPRTGLAKIEDENFIIYFNDEGKEIQKARKILDWANDGIPLLIDLLGKYPYPTDVHSRKLPVYFADNDDRYAEIVTILLGAPYKNIKNTAGLYISSYSRLGNMTTGIVLSPVIWRTDTYAREVLWHEMNHYGYFTWIEYDKAVCQYMWVYEGLAEYFSREEKNLSPVQAQLCLQYSLSATFPNYLANYWGGESVFRFIESGYGKEHVRKFVYCTYANTVDDAATSTFDKNLIRIEEEWKEWLNNE